LKLRHPKDGTEVTIRANIGPKASHADWVKRFWARLDDPGIQSARQVVRSSMPRYEQLLTDMVAKWHDHPENLSPKCCHALTLLNWLSACADGSHGEALRAYATEILPAFQRGLITEYAVFEWAFVQLEDVRQQRKLRLNAENVGMLLGTDPHSPLYDNLKELLKAKGTQNRTFAARALAAVRAKQTECKRKEEKRPLSDSVAETDGCDVREELIKLLKAKPINEGTFFWWCLKRDIPLPLGFLSFRPMMRYRMGTALLMVAGRQTGSCFFSHADMELGDDVTRKLHIGNFTFYAKPAVLQPRNIAYAPNIFCEEYLGGNGTHYFRYDEVDRQNLQDGIIDDRDMFCVAVPLEYKPERRFIDLTGRYDSKLCGGVSDESPLQYPNADIFSEYWGWSHPSVSNRPNPDDYTADSVPQYNTICVQDHQRNFLHKGNGKGTFEKVVINKGHWGPRVYPGCGRVRRGVETHLKPTKYEETSTMAIVV